MDNIITALIQRLGEIDPSSPLAIIIATGFVAVLIIDAVKS